MEEVPSSKNTDDISGTDSWWAILPGDVQKLILSYLSSADLSAAAQVIKKWQEFAYTLLIERNSRDEKQFQLFTAIKNKNIEALNEILNQDVIDPEVLEFAQEFDSHFIEQIQKWLPPAHKLSTLFSFTHYDPQFQLLLHKWMVAFPEGARALVEKYSEENETRKKLFLAIINKDLKALKIGLKSATLNELKNMGPLCISLYAKLNGFSQALDAIYAHFNSEDLDVDSTLFLMMMTHRPSENLFQYINYDSHTILTEEEKVKTFSYAITFGHYKAARHLNQHYNLLNRACRANNVAAVKKFVRSGGSAILDKALIISCKESSLEIIKILVAAGADVNAYSKAAPWYSNAQDELTPLCIACKRGNIEIVKFLISQGADVNDRFHPLNYAVQASQNNSQIINILIQHGATIDETSPFLPSNPDIAPMHETPLTDAVRKGNLELVKTLVALKADINRVEELHQQTPLHIACGSEHPNAIAIATFLLESGANADTTDWFRNHPLLSGYSERTPLLSLYYNPDREIPSAMYFKLMDAGANPLDLLGHLPKIKMTEITKGQKSFRKKIVLRMLDRWEKFHPADKELIQKMRAVLNEEPGVPLTLGERTSLRASAFFRNPLGRIYLLVYPFMKLPQKEVTEDMKEIEPLLNMDLTESSEASDSPRKIAQETINNSRSIIDNSNHDDTPATFPRSPSSSQTGFGLEDKGKAEMHPSSAPSSQPGSPKSPKK